MAPLLRGAQPVPPLRIVDRFHHWMAPILLLVPAILPSLSRPATDTRCQSAVSDLR